MPELARALVLWWKELVRFVAGAFGRSLRLHERLGAAVAAAVTAAVKRTAAAAAMAEARHEDRLLELTCSRKSKRAMRELRWRAGETKKRPYEAGQSQNGREEDGPWPRPRAW